MVGININICNNIIIIKIMCLQLLHYCINGKAVGIWVIYINIIISFNIYRLPEYLYGASAGGSCHAPVAMAKHTSLDLTSYI